MKIRLCLALSLATLAACQPQQLPSSTAAIKSKVEALGNEVIDKGERLSEGAEGAKQKLEQFGNATQAGAEKVKSGLTAVGDTVLSITGEEPRPGGTTTRP